MADFRVPIPSDPSDTEAQQSMVVAGRMSRIFFQINLTGITIQVYEYQNPLRAFGRIASYHIMKAGDTLFCAVR